jgi:uracil phosphoribosyltransferase
MDLAAAPSPDPAKGLGPPYRPDDQKPTATVSRDVPHETVQILPQTPQLIALLTYVFS